MASASPHSPQPRLQATQRGGLSPSTPAGGASQRPGPALTRSMSFCSEDNESPKAGRATIGHGVEAQCFLASLPQRLCPDPPCPHTPHTHPLV
jgi:hypothetical protein